MNRAQRIENLLREAFAPTELHVTDDSAAHAGHAGAASGAGHFSVVVVATAFAGKSRVARHRMVYDALRTMMTAEIHALVIQAQSPDER